MSYKRLTNEELNDFTSRVVVQLEPTLTQQVMSLILELTEYRNKIENGTLIELPCKVGDTVYYVERLWNNDWFRKGCFRWEILEYIITGIFIKGNVVVLYVNNDEDIDGREFTMWKKADGTFEFEELVEDYCFFTKAEAEKKLEELSKNP